MDNDNKAPFLDDAKSAVFTIAPGLTISGRRSNIIAAQTADDIPLIIAIHGGSYSSLYFDVPGYSLLDRAAALGIPVIALDRPGYGKSTPLPPRDAKIQNNAEQLDVAIGEIWKSSGKKGVVLIGHSIGGAVTISIAARRPQWPLLGISISGVGLRVPAESREAWQALPDIPMITLPPDRKDPLMLGPDWTRGTGMPNVSHIANAPVPRAELIDITTTWPENVRSITARVNVPVHYRQGEFDSLWITDLDQVRNFGASFTSAPHVDAALYASAGHCIDFHRLGAAFQLEQLAFALRCAVSRPQDMK